MNRTMNRIMNRMISAMLVSLFLLPLACSDDTTVIVPAVSVTISPGDAILTPGEELPLSVTLSPASTTDRQVDWQSSNNAVATVDPNGVVHAVAYGEVVITAGTQYSSGSCRIEVAPNIYVAGRIAGRNGETPALWHNGQLLWKAEKAGLIGSGGMTVVNGNTYVPADAYDASLRMSTACLYVNGEYRPLASRPGASSLAMGVAVRGDDIYVAGYCNFDEAPYSLPIVWKNGDVTYLTSLGGYANDIAVSDAGDVYVTGYYFTETGDARTPVWKNGEELFVCACDGSYAFGFAIACLGNDVYVAGNITDADGSQWAVVWKNGELYQRLHSGNSPFVSDLRVTPEGNIYAVGTQTVYPNPDNPFLSLQLPLLWVNGTEQTVGFSDRNNDLTSIFLFEDRVYTAGTYALFDGLNQGFYSVGDRRVDLGSDEWTTSAATLIYVTE